MAKKFYAIKQVGDRVVNSIVTDWITCKTACDNQYAIYKGFNTKEEAMEWLGLIPLPKHEMNKDFKSGRVGKKKSENRLSDDIPTDEIEDKFNKACTIYGLNPKKMKENLMKEWLLGK